MKKKSDGMRDEYDFRGGKRGRYAKRFVKDSKVVVIDPDVAEVFPDAKSVNDALRAIAGVVKKKGRR
jgi:ribose 5-phosphate isomerase